MSQPDNLQSVGGNAYRKTASGLSMLRETILGREQFDFAFKEYCRRWAYKRPEPADFFRTFEDAAGVDLDWFWRGWFFSTAQCDMEVTAVIRRQIDCGDPAQSAERQQRLDAPKPPNLALERDVDVPRRAERYESLLDFYETYDPHAVTEEQQEKFQKFLAQLTPAEKELLQFDMPLYEVRVHNHGELPMPLILKLEFEDGTSELRRLPVEIWRQAGHDVAALLVVPKLVTAVTVDPYNETADVNYGNNRFPRSIIETTLPLTKPEEKIENPLHDKLERERKAKAAAEKPDP
ncbi:hypothetical protein [Planctomicrobium piriforme]|uniref:Aminopeptidase N n=1 Tax=Planctomicrobium piriforme TaxID=1576369 RepID=A0A1I3B4Y3_9PLAN|nr:hypothetical protein [Planctomicrobium piriforme]SFH57292.1 hypothetical protein SAMN05421753_101236 [Planctomicrobium piriforme]